MKYEDWSQVQPDSTIGAVVFGFDLDINYKKYSKAFTYLFNNPECLFIATNNDLTYPANGTQYPGKDF